MTSFQGYAQSSSVEANTIKVHDPAKKILEEKRRKSDQMRRQGEAETKVRQDWIAAKRTSFEKEDAVRRSNEVLRKGFSADWQKGFSKQWETRIANAEAQAQAARNKKSTLEQVAHLLPKAMAIEEQIDGKRRKDGMALGNALSTKFGIDIENLDAIQNVKGNLRDLYAADTGAIAELREKGASFEEIQQIRKLSGYRRLGVQEAQLIRGKQSITNFWNNLNDKPLKLGGGLGEHSLVGAMRSGNKNQLVPAVNLEIEKQFLAQFEGFDQDLIKLHLSDAINRQKARINAYTHENDMKRAIADQQEEDKTLLETQINIDGPQAFIDAIHIGSGPNNEYMSHSVEQNGNLVASLIEEGRLGDDFILKLKEHPVLPNGEKVEVAYGKRWGKWIDKFEASSAKFKKNQSAEINAKLALEEARFKLQASQAEDKIIAEYENITESDFVEMYRMATEFNPKNTHLKTTIDKYLGMKRGGVNDELGEPILFRLENNNMLTRAAVINQRMSPEKTNKWLKKADKLNPYKPSDEHDKGFKKEAELAVENILTRYGTKSEKVQSSSMARQYGVKMMRMYYKKAIIDGNSPEQAQLNAISEFNKLLTTDSYKISERRNVDGKLIQEPHFPAFQVTPKKFAYPFSQYTTEKFRKNPNIFKEELMGPAEDLIEWGYGVESGTSKGIPPWIYHLTSKMGTNPDGGQKISPALVAYEQLVLAVGRKRADELIPRDLLISAVQVENKIDPSWRSIMCLGPNEAQCGLYWSEQTQSNTIKPRPVTGNVNTFKSGSIYRDESGLSDDALEFVKLRR